MRVRDIIKELEINIADVQELYPDLMGVNNINEEQELAIRSKFGAIKDIPLNDKKEFEMTQIEKMSGIKG